jgi:hypothetical protein
VLTPLKIVLFFQVTCLGWLLFGVKELSDAPLLLKNMLSPFELNGLTGLISVATFAAPVMLLDWLQNKSSDMLRIKAYPKALRTCVYVATFAAILLCGATGAKQFIYFQF